MTTVIAVPYRAAGCPHREKAWLTVSAHLASSGIADGIRVCDDGGEPFSRGNSLNLAFRDLAPDTVVVCCDADLLISATQLLTAVEMAAEAPGLVQPFDELHYLNADGSVQVWPLGPTVPLVGGCNILTAATWEQAGHWLTGQRGHCAEDIAFWHQAETLVAPLRRLAGPATHCWHPKSGAYTAPERILANVALADRVGALAGNRDGMRALLAELA